MRQQYNVSSTTSTASTPDQELIERGRISNSALSTEPEVLSEMERDAPNQMEDTQLNYQPLESNQEQLYEDPSVPSTKTYVMEEHLSDHLLQSEDHPVTMEIVQNKTISMERNAQAQQNLISENQSVEERQLSTIPGNIVPLIEPNPALPMLTTETSIIIPNGEEQRKPLVIIRDDPPQKMMHKKVNIPIEEPNTPIELAQKTVPPSTPKIVQQKPVVPLIKEFTSEINKPTEETQTAGKTSESNVAKVAISASIPKVVDQENNLVLTGSNPSEKMMHKKGNMPVDDLNIKKHITQKAVPAPVFTRNVPPQKMIHHVNMPKEELTQKVAPVSAPKAQQHIPTVLTQKQFSPQINKPIEETQTAKKTHEANKTKEAIPAVNPKLVAQQKPVVLTLNEGLPKINHNNVKEHETNTTKEAESASTGTKKAVPVSSATAKAVSFSTESEPIQLVVKPVQTIPQQMVAINFADKDYPAIQTELHRTYKNATVQKYQKGNNKFGFFFVVFCYTINDSYFKLVSVDAAGKKKKTKFVPMDVPIHYESNHGEPETNSLPPKIPDKIKDPNITYVDFEFRPKYKRGRKPSTRPLMELFSGTLYDKKDEEIVDASETVADNKEEQCTDNPPEESKIIIVLHFNLPII